MLVAYVSDERYVALPDVLLEFEGAGRLVRGPLAGDGFGPRRSAAGHVQGHASETRLRCQERVLSTSLGTQAPPLPAAVRRPAGLCVAQVGEGRRKVRVPGPFRRAVPTALWRYGLQKEFIRSLGWFDEHGPRATMQITPDGDYTQTGVAWNKYGYANPHLHQYVEAPERSGLYYFHARTATGASSPSLGSSHRRSRRRRVAVLASNITWNAYNNFGGRSNYINPDRLPPTPTVNARLELKRYTDPDAVTYDTEDYAPLSFDRPEPINHIDAHTEITDPIEGRAACHIAPAEWRLLGWLERENFAYDYYAETQLHDGTLDLDAYRVLIISTHPEYWSRTMYSRGQVVGSRARRQAHVPGRKRAELRGRVRRSHHGDLSQRRRPSVETAEDTRAGSICGSSRKPTCSGSCSPRPES